MLNCVSAPNTHSYVTAVCSRHPGARPRCHTLFSSHPLAFIHRHYPSIQYIGTQDYSQIAVPGWSTWRGGLNSSPCSYCILFYGTIIISQTGFGSPHLSFAVAEYISVANITGLLKQTVIYLILRIKSKTIHPPLMAELVVSQTDCSN